MFRNREEAGRMLADKLSQYRNDPTALILALPRGGGRQWAINSRSRHADITSSSEQKRSVSPTAEA
jgi:hypothetical protein